MSRIKNKRNLVMGILCCLLLLAACLIYRYAPLYASEDDEKVITIGVFSDSYWEVQNGYSYQILEDAIKVFEEQNPGVKVEYVSGILKDDYSEWLSEQLLSQKAPDVFFVLPEDFNDLSEIGALKNLSSFIEKDSDFDKSAFYSSAFTYGQYKDNQYALPYECAPKLMFVNKSILKQEKLEIPDKEWTWDDFYTICEKVTKDTDGNGVLDQFGVAGYTWKEAFESNGVELFDREGTKCNLTGTRVEEALSFLEKIDNLNKDYNVTGKDFDLGNVAFQPMSFSTYRAYKPYPLSVKKYSGFEWECIPMPAGKEGGNISTLDTLLIAMNADTRQAEYAWGFLKVLTSNPEIQAEIFDYSEGVSVLKEVTESDEALQRLMESSVDSSLNLEILSDAVESSEVAPRFRNYDKAIAEVDKAVQDIVGGDSNISMEQIIWNRIINKKMKNNEW